MYDDYDLDYTQAYDYAHDLDEMYDTYVHTHLDERYTYDLDDDYARDTHDYVTLAYQHYAWYNLILTEVRLC